MAKGKGLVYTTYSNSICCLINVTYELSDNINILNYIVEKIFFYSVAFKLNQADNYYHKVVIIR